MTTTSHAHQRPEKDREEVIPVDDVPAFGVQFRFAKRMVKNLVARLSRRR